jgi:hypothetical protein
MHEALDEDLFEKPEISYLDAFKWWEARRLMYNLIVGLSGVLPLLVSGIFFQKAIASIAFFICLAWAILANFCYFSGYLLELFDWKILKYNHPLLHNRKLLYYLGLIFSVLISGGCASLFAFAFSGIRSS